MSDRHTYRVAETFLSINGEGTRAGQLAFFIRFTGCNLRCGYCDTMWANVPDAPYTPMTAGELCTIAAHSGAENVTVTGGEPLLQEEIGPLLDRLGRDHFVEVETNGAVPLSPLLSLAHRPSFTMDYKLPGSGMEQFMCRENLSLLTARDTVKFVCSSREDLCRAAEIMAQYGLIGRTHVYLSPVFGRIDPADMVEFMKERNLTGVTLQLQMHKFIWDPNKRGV